MGEKQRFLPHRNHDCRIREYVWRGRRCVSLENRHVRLVICPDKGSDILEFTHKPTDTEVLYQNPAGLSQPLDASSSYLAGGPFRDQFSGGWFVMMPNGPVPCAHGGADFGHHGEATNMSWDYSVVDDRPERIEVQFRTRLRRMPVWLERRMVLESGEGRLILTETVMNESQQTIEVFWGHHPCFGTPFVSPDCKIDLPSGKTLSIGEGDDDFTSMTGFGDGAFTIRNPTLGVGFSLNWEAALFPVLGVWRQWGGASDYPAYGRHILALEPAIDFPSLAEAVAKGTALKLVAGQARSTTLEACVFAYAAKS